MGNMRKVRNSMNNEDKRKYDHFISVTCDYNCGFQLMVTEEEVVEFVENTNKHDEYFNVRGKPINKPLDKVRTVHIQRGKIIGIEIGEL
jgi:hypothetical protein